MPRHRHITYQRITHNGAQLGALRGGWANALVDPLQDHLAVDQQGLNQLLVERFEILEACSGQQADFVYLQDRFESILDQLTANDPENVQYFYHSDHLGSSSFITDASGTVDQHLQYLPFGEPWIDQRTNTGIRFTFSGKEKDEETGYSYFGARYYNADISVWLSVDPLSDERAWLTGYNYVQNNPLKLIDPTGMLDEPPTKAGKNNGETHFDHDNKITYEWNSEHRTWYVSAAELDAVDVIGKRKSYNDATLTDFGNLNNTLTVTGATFGAFSTLTASNGYILGKNGKYYASTGRGPNQFTGSRSEALKVANQYKLAGTATLLLSASVGVYSTIEGYELDGNNFDYNAQLAVARTIGSAGFGLLGAKTGAAAGAAIGSMFGGIGAIPGAVIGGAIGGFGLGIWGSYEGSNLGERIVDSYHGRNP